MPHYWDWWAFVQGGKYLVERWYAFVTEDGKYPQDWP